MSDISNLRDTVIPKSDQLNADQLLGSPITITITNVRRGEADQPITIGYEGDNGRPYKPCKTMRKVMIFAWGEDGNLWIGRRMTLYCDASIMFGGIKVGGIRISHMSHLERDLSVSLTATKGKKAAYIIKQLQLNAVEEITLEQQINIEALAKDVGVSITAICGRAGIANLSELPSSSYDSVIKKLEAARNRAA